MIASKRTMSSHHLPIQPTLFIGRVSELAEITRQLSDPAHRLLTLTGPGGIGKTRLAVQAAAALAAHFKDGVYFVPLQAVSSPEFLFPAIAEILALPLSGQQDPDIQLIDYLRNKQLLLILDTFEHLADDSSPWLVDLLKAAPALKLLVTSRKALNLREEWLYLVQGMDFPTEPLPSPEAGPEPALLDSSPPPEKSFENYSAVQLFVERARQARWDFSLESEWPWVGRICQLVEGVPLAIELAAAWTKTLSCELIAAEIESNLDFLATNLRNIPERQRSMRAVFDQSWKLLGETERAVFSRLAVFRGGFQREAAERIAGATLDILSGLVDKSLLRREPGGRYQIHELLRQYAAAHLARSAEDIAYVYDRHCSYYTGFLHRRLPDILGGRQRQVALEIAAELENIRAAWQWATELRKAEELQQSAHALILFYQIQGRYLEGIKLFERAAESLSRLEPSGLPGLALAEILVELGWLYIRPGQLEQAKTALEQGQNLFSRLEASPPPGLGTEPLIPLALLAVLQGDYTRAIEAGEQACRLSEARADLQNLATAHYILTGARLARGEVEAAGRHAQQAYALAKTTRNGWFRAYCLLELGNVACALEDYSAARGYYEACYALRREFDDPEGMAVAFNHLGKIAILQERYEEARCLYQQSLAFYRRINDRGGLATALGGLGTVAGLSGEGETARRYFQEALQIAGEIQFMALSLALVLEIGALLGRYGQPERAVALLALVHHHPAADRETRDRAQRFLDHYQAKLSLELFSGATRRGQNSDLEVVIVTLQVELAAAPPLWPAWPGEEQPQAAEKNGAAPALKPRAEGHHPELVEPLTNREFEVLELIASGMTNQEMADTLILSAGTVKWYTSQIYGKLNVSSRTQAIARARELALLN